MPNRDGIPAPTLAIPAKHFHPRTGGQREEVLLKELRGPGHQKVKSQWEGLFRALIRIRTMKQ